MTLQTTEWAAVTYRFPRELSATCQKRFSIKKVLLYIFWLGNIEVIQNIIILLYQTMFLFIQYFELLLRCNICAKSILSSILSWNRFYCSSILSLITAFITNVKTFWFIAKCILLITDCLTLLFRSTSYSRLSHCLSWIN